ncbi:unnamed protein product, partial [Pylaiella littoralis]
LQKPSLWRSQRPREPRCCQPQPHRLLQSIAFDLSTDTWHAISIVSNNIAASSKSIISDYITTPITARPSTATSPSTRFLLTPSRPPPPPLPPPPLWNVRSSSALSSPLRTYTPALTAAIAVAPDAPLLIPVKVGAVEPSLL